MARRKPNEAVAGEGIIRWTIPQAAAMFGCKADTIRIEIQRRGGNPQRGDTFTVRELFNAARSDWKEAQTRKALAEAENRETKTAILRGDLLPKDEVVSFIRKTFGPVREQVLAMPAVLSGKVNPADPEHARAHLEQWRDLFLRQCKEHLPQ